VSTKDLDDAEKARQWRLVEDLMAEAEVERVEGLSDQDLHAEVRAAGMDPDRLPGVDDLLRRGKERAALRAAAGPAAPSNGRAEGRLLTLPLAPARAMASRRMVWLVAAGFALALGAIGIAERDAIVAMFKKTPVDIKPDPDSILAPNEVAAKLRDDAEAACTDGKWGLCERKLDEAALHDPAGEKEPRVVKLRADILENTGPRQNYDDKGVAPSKKP
jgi:hypothetical protein